MTAFEVPNERRIPLFVALRNALGIVAILWVLLGIINFGFLTDHLVKTSSGNLLRASFWLSLGFGASCAIVVVLIVVWQRRHGETLVQLGWRRPTRPRAVIIAVLFGFLWTLGAYTQPGANPASFLAFPWERPIMMLVGVLLAFGEELSMRGFFMEQLRRGGVSTSLQVVTAGLAMGSYHGLIGFHYSFLYAFFSALIFTIVGIIFVVGQRSLTPVVIAHAMTHFFGDPELLMGLLRGAISMGR